MYGLYKGNSTYECLGFLALEDQINFAKAYCNSHKLNAFTEKVLESEGGGFASSLSKFITKLYNNLLLNGYGRDEIAHCSNIILYEQFASSIDPEEGMQNVRNITSTMNGEIQAQFSTTTVSPEASTHKHRHHHGHRNATAKQRNRRGIDENIKEKIPSSAGKPKSWINIAVSTFANAITSTAKGISQFISSSLKPELPPTGEAPSANQNTHNKRNPSSKFCEQFSGDTSVQNNINAIYLILQTVCDRICPLPKEHSITNEEALAYAINVTAEFERILKDRAKECGISAKNLNFNNWEVQEIIRKQALNNEQDKILKTLCSAGKEACPKFKQTDKFLACLRNHLEETLAAKEAVFSLNSPQDDVSPSKILEKTPATKLSKENGPNTTLNGTSIAKRLNYASLHD